MTRAQLPVPAMLRTTGRALSGITRTQEKGNSRQAERNAAAVFPADATAMVPACSGTRPRTLYASSFLNVPLSIRQLRSGQKPLKEIQRSLRPTAAPIRVLRKTCGVLEPDTSRRAGSQNPYWKIPDFVGSGRNGRGP